MATRSPDDISVAQKAIIAEMRTRHNVPAGEPDDVTAQTQDDIVALRTQQTQTMTTLLAGIAGVSLIVGGIGIMNIMLVSVTERTREIGVRKALGALRRDIIGQFLIEAVTLSSLGGLIGVALGVGISALIKANVPQLPTEIPLWSPVVGLAVSMGVGIFFGAYPAVKASRLDPIESLRYE